MVKKSSVDKPKSESPMRWLVFVSRLLVGGTFIFSGLVKSIDPYGTLYKFQDYFAVFHLDFLSPFAMLFAVALSMAEFLFGVHILFGSYRKSTPRLVLALMGVMTPLTLYLAIANPIADCGCFGDAIHLSNWATFFKNVILLGFTIVLVRYNQRLRPLYNHQVQWLTGLFAMLYSGAFAYVGIEQQPYLDFRPYKIGLNIPDALAAGEPEKEYIFVYEREGKKQEFTLDNLPAEEEGWTFVDRIEKEIPGEKSDLPVITDFSIYQDDEEITDEILYDEDYRILLLSPEVEDADDSEVDRINELYDYSMEQGYEFACVTSSSPEEIERWSEDTGAEYPFYFMDKTAIRTIARGNPAVMLLKEGTILRKEAPSRLPDEIELTAPLDQLRYGNQQDYNPSHRMWTMGLLFVIPMLLLLLMERVLLMILNKMRARRRRKVEAVAQAQVAPVEENRANPEEEKQE